MLHDRQCILLCPVLQFWILELDYSPYLLSHQQQVRWSSFLEKEENTDFIFVVTSGVQTAPTKPRKMVVLYFCTLAGIQCIVIQHVFQPAPCSSPTK
jgi:hypothetical protein